MLTGKEKALLLVSLLPEQSKDILPLLSPESAKIMTESIEDAPKVDEDAYKAFLSEVVETTEQMKYEDSGEDTQEVADEDVVIDEGGEEEEEQHAEDTDEETDLEDDPSDKDVGKGLDVLSELRSHEAVAEKLVLQKPQIVAFIFSRLAEDERESIESHMDDDLVTKIGKMKVENLPLGEKIFKNLYDVVFKKSPEELELEQQGGFSASDEMTEDVSDEPNLEQDYGSDELESHDDDQEGEGQSSVDDVTHQVDLVDEVDEIEDVDNESLDDEPLSEPDLENLEEEMDSFS